MNDIENEEQTKLTWETPEVYDLELEKTSGGVNEGGYEGLWNHIPS